MNASCIQIREFQTGERIPPITALLHEAYASLAAMGFRYLATHQDDAMTEERLRAGDSFVAELAGQIVGVVTLRRAKPDSSCPWYLQPDVWSFGQFAVQPKRQGQGIGRRLLAAVEQRAIQHGARELALDTAEGAAHLIAWYERLGFRFIEQVSWPDTNYRSVVMSKSLSAQTIENFTAR